MVHLNGNLIAAIHIRTTGPDPKTDDIFEVCIMPATHGLKPDMKKSPYHFNLGIKDPESFKDKPFKIKGIDKTEFYKRQVGAMDPYKAADLLEEWHTRLGMKTLRQVMPLAWNWAQVRPFMIEWLGVKTFEYIFHPEYRDIMPTILFANDRADITNTQIPYPKTGQFSYIATRVGDERSHDCHETCANMIEAYRKITYAFS